MTKHGIEKKDLLPYIYPPNEIIAELGITGIFLGHFLKWVVFKQIEIVKKLGFNEFPENREGTYDRWENLDTKYTVFHDYFKWLKFGYGRATDHTSLEIRTGRMTRQKGLELVKEYDGKIPRKFLDDFLRDAELTYDEFLKICDKFTNKELFQTDQNGNFVKDKDGNLTLKNEIT